jgi:hypothetical protein
MMSMNFDLNMYCGRFCVEHKLTEDDAVEMYSCIAGIMQWDYYDDSERNDELDSVRDQYQEYYGRRD